MTILIINSQNIGIPGVSVFSCDATGKTDNNFTAISDADGIIEIPAIDFDYLAFRSIGYTTQIIKSDAVPEIVELSAATEMLDAVSIKPEPETAAISWGVIIGIIAAITLIGLGITYLKNQSIKK